jgi:hypothetical protein
MYGRSHHRACLALTWLRMSSASLVSNDRQISQVAGHSTSMRGDLCSSPVELIFVDIIYDRYRTVNGRARVLS